MPCIYTPVLALPLHYILYCHLGLHVPRDHFSQAPINVATLPILLSNSFSIPPFPHKLIPRYTICFACSNCTVPPPLYTQQVPCMFVFPSLFWNLLNLSMFWLTCHENCQACWVDSWNATSGGRLNTLLNNSVQCFSCCRLHWAFKCMRLYVWQSAWRTKRCMELLKGHFAGVIYHPKVRTHQQPKDHQQTLRSV